MIFMGRNIKRRIYNKIFQFLTQKENETALATHIKCILLPSHAVDFKEKLSQLYEYGYCCI